ncbi:hypothetical protein EDD16DRAFT_1519822 [Pisolithus croceorrhizus]|nr:hypothetical protein EDD16DRAFT_1519822 [Pisolithus croceorrhizus]KAI6135365.1 hypothetical protein EV401DRAFT_1882005 [Pisolithus croceorrhizus]KAI6158948.1 hypothetical protein EDD17DRAFT_1511614 [Pisolithus thermaeus]
MPSGPSPPCPCIACMLSALTACSQPYSKGLLTEIHGVGSSWGEQATEHVFHLYNSMQGSRHHGMTLDWILGQISSVLRPQNVPSLLSPQFESDFALTKSSSQSLGVLKAAGMGTGWTYIREPLKSWYSQITMASSYQFDINWIMITWQTFYYLVNCL